MLEVRVVDVDAPDAVRLVHAYFDELRERFGFEPPTRDELRADAARGVIVVGYENETAVACGSLRLLESDTGEVKRVFVVPAARGEGHARSVLFALERWARSKGCRRVVLDTAESLREAGALYLSAGYAEIPRYNDNPYASRWFEKALDRDRQ